MKSILLFPFSGNAREAVSVIQDFNRDSPTWDILGFVDDDHAKAGSHFGDFPILGGREAFADNPDAWVLAVPGRPDSFKKRKELINSLPIAQDRFATIIHPSTIVGLKSSIGKNVLLMANVALTSNAVIGRSVVILPNTVVSHDSCVGDYSMVGSNVSISGGVQIGPSCYIGSGAKIIQEIEIGAMSMVGIGTVVIRDVKPESVVAGNPARDIRRSNEA